MDDYSAYANSERFFCYLRSRMRALRRAHAELVERDDMVRAVRYEAGGHASGGNHVEDAMAAAADRRDVLREEIARTDELRAIALGAIDRMERDGACADNDGRVLRMRYIEDLKPGTIARELHYSASYVPDKTAVALMHVAPYVPGEW